MWKRMLLSVFNILPLTLPNRCIHSTFKCTKSGKAWPTHRAIIAHIRSETPPGRGEAEDDDVMTQTIAHWGWRWWSGSHAVLEEQRLRTGSTRKREPRSREEPPSRGLESARAAGRIPTVCWADHVGGTVWRCGPFGAAGAVQCRKTDFRDGVNASQEDLRP